MIFVWYRVAIIPRTRMVLGVVMDLFLFSSKHVTWRYLVEMMVFGFMRIRLRNMSSFTVVHSMMWIIIVSMIYLILHSSAFRMDKGARNILTEPFVQSKFA